MDTYDATESIALTHNGTIIKVFLRIEKLPHISDSIVPGQKLKSCMCRALFRSLRVKEIRTGEMVQGLMLLLVMTVMLLSVPGSK